MSTPPLTELTARTRDIFRVVVEQYLATGQPVGSKTLAEGGAVDLSPASIRSVLADLEKLGLLAAPHVSAGRKPTESGLRLFVDGMMQITQPSAQERAAIEARLGDPGPLEQRLEAASSMLSDLSGAAGMVFVPTAERRLAQMSFVPLDTSRALAVLVDANGQIENRLIELEGVDAGTLTQASNYLSALLANRSLGRTRRAVRQARAGGPRGARGRHRAEAQGLPQGLVREVPGARGGDGGPRQARPGGGVVRGIPRSRGV